MFCFCSTGPARGGVDRHYWHVWRVLVKGGIRPSRSLLGWLCRSERRSAVTSVYPVGSCETCCCMVRTESSFIRLQYWRVWESGKSFTIGNQVYIYVYVLYMWMNEIFVVRQLFYLYYDEIFIFLVVNRKF